MQTTPKNTREAQAIANAAKRAAKKKKAPPQKRTARKVKRAPQEAAPQEPAQQIAAPVREKAPPREHERAPLDFTEGVRRQKAREKRNFRVVQLAVVLCVVVYFTGGFSYLFTQGSTLYETMKIAVAQQAGYPVQTGISVLYQAEELSGGFVALGAESCVVYSSGGNRLRAIEAGYLNPTISAGNTRFVLYNRGGKEFRIESRTETIYTKTLEDNILLCSMSANGSVAVATESTRYLAKVTLYSATLQEQLSFSMTESEGAPLCMAYAPNSKTLALATIGAQDGKSIARVYLLTPSSGEVVCLVTETDAVPLALLWRSNTELAVVYDSHIALYDTGTQSLVASYDYADATLVDVATSDETIALLLAGGEDEQVVLLGETFDSQVGDAQGASAITLDGEVLYVQCEDILTAYEYSEEAQGDKLGEWTFETAPLAVLAAGEIIVFTQNAATTLALN